MPLLKRKRVLAAKIETVIGTAETLAGADAAFNVYNPMIQAAIEMEPREGQGGFGYLSSVPAGRIGTATFRTNLEWDGTATEPAWADTFFPACGWVKSGQVYTHAAKPQERTSRRSRLAATSTACSNRSPALSVNSPSRYQLAKWATSTGNSRVYCSTHQPTLRSSHPPTRQPSRYASLVAR